MFIQTESTPNPATLKFLPGLTVLESGSAHFDTVEEAAVSPLAERLFGVPGVTGVFYGSDFITVTKDDLRSKILRSSTQIPPGAAGGGNQCEESKICNIYMTTDQSCPGGCSVSSSLYPPYA